MADGDSQSTLVYAGTYTRTGPDSRGRADGIHILRFDPLSGELSPSGVVPDVPNPSFLALHPGGQRLYAVNETTEIDGRVGGAVSAFAIDVESGALTYLQRKPSHGGDPCHLSVDRAGRVVLVANYASGTVAMLPLQPDGRLDCASDVHQHRGASLNPERQSSPHPHQIVPDPTNRYALVADLGLDEVRVYALDLAAGRLVPRQSAAATLPPGSGPRHLAFRPDAGRVYIINELSSTVTACSWDAQAGVLHPIQTISTLPDGFSGSNSCAEITIDPSGRFAYGSNRGHDSIAIFAIDPVSGELSSLGHVAIGGAEPRHFAIDPSGGWLLAANQESDTIVTFHLDRETGRLTATGAVAQVPSPVCLLFAGRV
jgi:6-phosphogluconolactonase